MTPGQMLLVAAVLIVIGGVMLAMKAKRDPNLQAKALKLLPDAGDRIWLALQSQLPDDHEFRDKLRRELDAADAKADEFMINRLKSKGYTVSK